MDCSIDVLVEEWFIVLTRLTESTPGVVDEFPWQRVNLLIQGIITVCELFSCVPYITKDGETDPRPPLDRFVQFGAIDQALVVP